MPRGRRPRAAAPMLLALVLASVVPVDARLPARLIVTCAPRVSCQSTTRQLHSLLILPSYRFERPGSEPASTTTRSARAVRRALRFRTDVIRPRESEEVQFFAEVALSPSSAMGGFTGSRRLRFRNLARHEEPVSCSILLTACSPEHVGELGVSPSRYAKLCRRARQRLRRRLGIVAIETAPVSFPIARCRVRAQKATTTSSSSSTTSTSEPPPTTSTTATTMP